MRKRRRVVVTDSDDEERHKEEEVDSDDLVDESDEDSIDDFIDDSGEVEEREERESEEEFESEESSDEQEEGYIPKEEMRALYKQDMNREERPGYEESREHYTQEDPETTWRRVKAISCEDGGRKYGLRATERVANRNETVRVIERVEFGSEYAGNETQKCGRYMEILVPLIERLFNQKAYQPHPVTENIIPPFAFKGWEMITHANAEQDFTEMDFDHWCICCQNYWRNKLHNIQILRHEKSGIYIKTGGDCAGNIMGLTAKEAEARCAPCNVFDPESEFMRILG